MWIIRCLFTNISVCNVLPTEMSHVQLQLLSRMMAVLLQTYNDALPGAIMYLRTHAGMIPLSLDLWASWQGIHLSHLTLHGT